MTNSNRVSRKCFYVFFLWPLITTTAFADKITLQDGSILMGTVTHMVEGQIHIETAFAGALTVPMEQIVEMETADVKPIHLHDGSVIQGTIQTREANRMDVIWGKDQTRFAVVPADIQAIDPPPPPPAPTPTPVRWTGSVVGNLSITSGNRDTTGVGISADLARRSEDDRITLKGGYFYAEDRGNGIRDDQYLSGKYDYFFTKKFFGYLNTRLDRDAIRDLELRTTGGAGLGYQFLETDIYNLFTEAGVSYVNEDFMLDVDDQTYVAGRLAMHFGWWIIKDRLRFEEDAELLLGMTDLNDWFGISDSSLIWKWNSRLSSNASVRFEYDNTPATGRKRADTKYTLGIGYSF
jgi:putative salt-induced outer membrane protein YdiY